MMLMPGFSHRTKVFPDPAYRPVAPDRSGIVVRTGGSPCLKLPPVGDTHSCFMLRAALRSDTRRKIIEIRETFIKWKYR